MKTIIPKPVGNDRVFASLQEAQEFVAMFVQECPHPIFVEILKDDNKLEYKWLWHSSTSRLDASPTKRN